ncbi:MAG: hypothetical protein C4530_22480 [Desulfobacteraceae bacterium]|nr:MAG: hypothetical protein C4530_22480 [Desulfobacteraceae bacterium]
MSLSGNGAEPSCSRISQRFCKTFFLSEESVWIQSIVFFNIAELFPKQKRLSTANDDASERIIDRGAHLLEKVQLTILENIGYTIR